MQTIRRTREKARNKVEENTELSIALHRTTTIILSLNVAIIIYTLITLIVRLGQNGISIIDSIPIALYILPLMVFLPLIIKSYYKSNSALIPFIITLIMCGFYVVLSNLVRGFIILFIMNLAACSFLILLGNFRIKGEKKKLGKKGILWIIFLNLIGLLFPVSIVVMGQTQIAEIEPSIPTNLMIDIPLTSLDFPYIEVAPSSVLLDSLVLNSFGLSFRVLAGDIVSTSRLESWLLVLNETSIPYEILSIPNREEIANSGQSKILHNLTPVFNDHQNALHDITDIITINNITNLPISIIYDMTLSKSEWGALMNEARDLDLVGFSALIRDVYDSISDDSIETKTAELVQVTHTLGFGAGVLAEPYVLDDLQDMDTIVMKSSGVTVDSIHQWDSVQIISSRSRFSFEMLGDVGEYLVHSYSKSIAIHDNWSIRLGCFGNFTDIAGRENIAYQDIDTLVNDIGIAAGNGVSTITLESLPHLLETFGASAIDLLKDRIDNLSRIPVTYTFRIYAFRIVFLAIDAFDPIML